MCQQQSFSYQTPSTTELLTLHIFQLLCLPVFLRTTWWQGFVWPISNGIFWLHLIWIICQSTFCKSSCKLNWNHPPIWPLFTYRVLFHCLLLKLTTYQDLKLTNPACQMPLYWLKFAIGFRYPFVRIWRNDNFGIDGKVSHWVYSLAN